MHLMAASVATHNPRRFALRISSDFRCAIPLACCILLLPVATLISGCGNSSDTSAPPMPTNNAPQAHTAASGPAISDKLFFDQLTLESPAKPDKDKNGLVFLRFKYADNDGKVYECILPKAMSEGQYTLAEWSSTFAAYRLPKVIAVKTKSSQEDLGDYPFISPKPQEQKQPEGSAGQPSQPPMPMPMPTPQPHVAGPVAPGLGEAPP